MRSAWTNWISHLPVMDQVERQALGVKVGPPLVSEPFLFVQSGLRLAQTKLDTIPTPSAKFLLLLNTAVDLKGMKRNILAFKDFFV